MTGNNKKVLVTGAIGYLGGVAALELERYGYEVIRLSRYARHLNSIIVDLADKTSLSKLNELENIDAVCHFACVLPGRMPDDQLLITNQLIDRNIIEWACKAKIKHFIAASTCNVYGLTSTACDEESPLNPPNVYALSKIIGENIILQAALTCLIKVTIFRISAPYGPSLKTNTVVKNFINSVKSGKEIILKGSGAREQNFVFETDIAYACHLALSNGAEGVFNVSGSEMISMKQLAQKIISIADKKTEIKYEGDDTQEFFRGNYPTDKARKAFEYIPQVMLAEGLKQTYFSGL
ncbi:MAG: NAD(P)-dependent oxidoreductase [Bacteroidia bacterium]